MSEEPSVNDAGPASTDPATVSRPPEARRGTTSPLSVLGATAAGFAMGAADVVPGFSGGSVALAAGIYQRLVANVRQGARALSLLLRGQLAAFGRALLAIEWVFVVPLAGGLGAAIIALASVLEVQLAAHPIAMSALLLGLVLGATVVAVPELRAPGPVHLGITAVVAVIAFVLLGARSGTVADPSPLLVFVAGAVAVSAWILPGISGAFILLLIGVYEPVLSAVSNRDLAVVGTLLAGCVVGLAAFSTLLQWLLHRYHDLVLAAGLGLMVGSARVLWPWPSTDGVGDPTLGVPSGEVAVPVLAGLGAMALVVAVGLGGRWLVARREARPL